ncbi:hypothetical protein TNCV_492181 [Trichonephila clavipes]|nr:hypothetical protein TNCV_492181 [Trichonephila clavipes]
MSAEDNATALGFSNIALRVSLQCNSRLYQKKKSKGLRSGKRGGQATVHHIQSIFEDMYHRVDYAYAP